MHIPLKYHSCLWPVFVELYQEYSFLHRFNKTRVDMCKGPSYLLKCSAAWLIKRFICGIGNNSVENFCQKKSDKYRCVFEIVISKPNILEQNFTSAGWPGTTKKKYAFFWLSLYETDSESSYRCLSKFTLILIDSILL